ncbi:hypothetical protein K503DRAFT_792016 [Rhizopogon vinicolor AM-OR11-026]|uniref:Outer kinetochore protein DAD2 n=1 Tax=Rhizopogon vinicolor AM-OR11-026 TaxID=1314800 RepID=A0A1B7N3D6_9AGAM|nr:hypothetical protein K503DRAFT_792016 [Rhizopogon vinicolor AM-OR11-026]
MRQSVALSRISQAASLTHSNNAAAMSRLQEKKKEFEAVAALQRASALFLKHIEGLADALRIHGQVLEQWPLLLNSRKQYSAEPDDALSLTRDRLIRVPLDELQPDASKQS